MDGTLRFLESETLAWKLPQPISEYPERRWLPVHQRVLLHRVRGPSTGRCDCYAGKSASRRPTLPVLRSPPSPWKCRLAGKPETYKQTCKHPAALPQSPTAFTLVTCDGSLLTGRSARRPLASTHFPFTQCDLIAQRTLALWTMLPRGATGHTFTHTFSLHQLFHSQNNGGNLGNIIAIYEYRATV